MASKDQKSCLKFVGSIAPQAATGNVNGTGVDTLGFESATMLFHGDGTAVGTVKLQDSTDNSTWADAASGDVIGTQDRALDATDTAVTLAYIGEKRYVRAVFTHTTNGDISAAVALGNARIEPVTGN